MHINANGITYAAERHQEDPRLSDLVLWHGFMGSSRCFAHLINRLKLFCNPLTVDLLGHGQTGGTDSPDRFLHHRQLQDMQVIINQLCKTPPYLHGYSMGGRLALRYGLTYPATIRGLILESTTYGLEDQHQIKQRLQTDEERARAIEEDFASFLKKWNTMPLFLRGISLPKKQLNFYHSIQRQQEARQMANSLRGFSTAAMPSVKKQLADIKIPVLLLVGQTDLKYAGIARQMHKMIPDSTLAIIPEAGHRVHLEHPTAFTAEIESFITKLR